MRLNIQIKLFIFILCCISFNALAQDLPKSLRNKKLLISSDSTRIDTLSLVPGSVRIFSDNGQLIVNEDFSIQHASSRLLIKRNREIYLNKIFTIEYRVFPVDFTKSYQHKDSMLILKNYQKVPSHGIYRPADKENFFEEDNLDKNGSISRGFVIGNQRDLGTLSNFNLQLSGKLNDEVSILAAVSDNNMPVQPEGNTQQLQEFDKVNILMFTKKSGIELGDIALNKPAGYFLNLKKQTRGIRAYSDFTKKVKNTPVIKSEFSSGLAKGKYNRQLFNGMEGNQGPYKLLGNNYESYIIVLSGSEKIYLNGKLLIRGEQFDYVIDYNTAEITFTANQPITKDSRIVAEYEYSQQYFPRVQFLQTNYLKTKKSSFWLNFYLENDNKNDPLSESYSDETKIFLSQLGDNTDKAYAPNVRNVGYSPDKVLYLLKDSIVGAENYDSVFVYSTDAEQAIYQLGFSYVGEKKGHYRPVSNNVNGKVYEWVAPVNGIRQGNYEPVSLYVSPKKMFMTNLGGEFQLGNTGHAGFEFALSNYDANTYSNIDKSNDVGYALKLKWRQGLLKKDTAQSSLNLFADIQLVNKNFHPVENYHEAEFERNWNLPVQTNSWQELNYNLGFNFRNINLGMINGQASLMQRAESYSGQKALFTADLGSKGFRFQSQVSYLNTKNPFSSTDYLKHMMILSRETKLLVLGISEESEENRWHLKGIDSLSANSFKFSEYAIFVKRPDSVQNNFFASYKFRNDFLPEKESFRKWNSAQTVQAGFRISKRQDINLKSVITYRKVNFIDTLSKFEINEDYISGREEMNLRFVKGSIFLSGFYETGSGLEIKKQYQFIEVQNGQGQYTWFDYNQNGIKETDEFEAAKFSDQANYIMVFTPSEQYLRVYTTQFNQTLFIQPERLWRESNGLKGFLANFSEQFAFQIIQKTDIPDFIPDLKDNINTISKLITLRNNLSYKTKSRKLQLDYMLDAANSKNLLFNGTDFRVIKNQAIKLKYRLYKTLTLYNATIFSQNEFESDYFSWKNYKIKSSSDELKLEFQPAESLISSVLYKLTKKNNLTGFQVSNLNELKFSMVYEISLKTNLQADFSYISTFYDGEVSSPIEYEMLDGLKKGRNLLWSLSYNQKLSKVLFLNISYMGRSSEKNPTIHNGGIQLRANF